MVKDCPRSIIVYVEERLRSDRCVLSSMIDDTPCSPRWLSMGEESYTMRSDRCVWKNVHDQIVVYMEKDSQEEK